MVMVTIIHHFSLLSPCKYDIRSSGKLCNVKWLLAAEGFGLDYLTLEDYSNRFFLNVSK